MAKRGKQKNDSRVEHKVKGEMGPNNNNNKNNNNIQSMIIPIGIKQQTFLFDFHCSL